MISLYLISVKHEMINEWYRWANKYNIHNIILYILSDLKTHLWLSSRKLWFSENEIYANISWFMSKDVQYN